MHSDPDDLLPEQKGLTPRDEVLAAREQRGGLGRVWRLRSLGTIAIALAIILLLAFVARNI